MTETPGHGSARRRRHRLRTAAVGIMGGLALVVILAAISGKSVADRRASELAAERSVAQTRHGKLEYIRWGEGLPVLIVHGAGGGFDQGRLLAKAIGGADLQFVSVSRFGYLDSDLPADPSIAAQAEAFADLLDSLGLSRVSILAMSGGVPPALKFAELYPERTDRLVLLSSAPFTPFGPQIEDWPVPDWAYTALMGSDAVYWALTKVARGVLRKAFDARSDLMIDASPDEQRFVDHLIDGFLPASARLAGVGNEGAAVDPLATYRLEVVRAPTLVVHSQDDRLNPVAIAKELGTRIPSARMILFERGGHLLLGHHAELRARVGDFLSGERPALPM